MLDFPEKAEFLMWILLDTLCDIISLFTEKSLWVVKRFWNKGILEIIQFRYMYLIPSRHDVVTTSGNVAIQGCSDITS